MDIQISEFISTVKGKTIAVVYIFENEPAAGYLHYDVWQSDVLTSWLNAIQELGCMPYIMDARTFVYKAMNNSLPVIDFVVNLNNGNIDLSTLALVPSVCSFLSIPCIPCNAVSTITGESKILSNLIAYAKNLNIPKELDNTVSNGIFRPENLGSSRGVKRDPNNIKQQRGVYQEFILGFDITTPILYNPVSQKMEVLPAVMYYPSDRDISWFLGEEEKEKHAGYRKVLVQIDEKAKDRYLELANTIQVNTYCRVDARVRCDKPEDMDYLIKSPIPFDRINFLEINPMPTIKDNINFHTSLEGLTSDLEIYSIIQQYNNKVPNHSLTGFILLCSMLSLIKAKH